MPIVQCVSVRQNKISRAEYNLAIMQEQVSRVLETDYN